MSYQRTLENRDFALKYLLFENFLDAKMVCRVASVSQYFKKIACNPQSFGEQINFDFDNISDSVIEELFERGRIRKNLNSVILPLHITLGLWVIRITEVVRSFLMV